MATTYVGPGGTVDYTAGSAISSGDVVVMGTATTGGSCVGVALTDIANGSVGAVAIQGVFTIAKVSTAVIAQGDTVNWIALTSNVDDNADTKATGDVEDFGVAMAAAGNGTTTVNVLLLPGNGVLSA